jgi:hypothetical protein
MKGKSKALKTGQNKECMIQHSTLGIQRRSHLPSLRRFSVIYASIGISGYVLPV